MALETILFDADDTLWYDARYFRTLEKQLVKYAEKDGVDSSKTIQLLRNTVRLEVGLGEARFIKAVIKCCLQLCPKKVELLRKDCEVFQNHKIELLPNVKEVLSHIQQKKILVTKGSKKEQLLKLERSGLAHFFEKVHVVNRKDKNVYLEVISGMEAGVHDTLMIGNSIRDDVVPIIEIGGVAVWFNHFENFYGDNAPLPKGADMVRNWTQISKLLGQV